MDVFKTAVGERGRGNLAKKICFVHIIEKKISRKTITKTQKRKSTSTAKN